MNSIAIEMAMNVDPSGFPTWCSFDSFPPPVMDVFKRKSCVIAMPIEAKEREVRSHARKVRSVAQIRSSIWNRRNVSVPRAR